MSLPRSVRIASYLGGAVLTFLICSLVQAAGGSNMFSQSYTPPDSVLLDLALNVTFWPGWAFTIACLVGAGKAALEDDAPPGTSATPDAGVMPAQVQASQAPRTQSWILPFVLSMVPLVLLAAGGVWYWSHTAQQRQAAAFGGDTSEEWYWSEGLDEPSSAHPSTSEPPTYTYTSTVTVDPTETTEEYATEEPEDDGICAPSTAESELESRRQETLATEDLDGRWVLQIDSKYPGVVDPLQTAPDGTHTFSTSDICEHQLGQADEWQYAAGVLHLKASDFGEQRDPERADETWVLLLDPGVDSLAPMGEGQVTDEEARQACDDFFPDLEGDDLANACVARRLTPPR